jgi:hypothetical protein
MLELRTLLLGQHDRISPTTRHRPNRFTAHDTTPAADQTELAAGTTKLKTASNAFVVRLGRGGDDRLEYRPTVPQVSLTD